MLHFGLHLPRKWYTLGAFNWTHRSADSLFRVNRRRVSKGNRRTDPTPASLVPTAFQRSTMRSYRLERSPHQRIRVHSPVDLVHHCTGKSQNASREVSAGARPICIRV